MKLLQWYDPKQGIRLGMLDGEDVIDISAAEAHLNSMLALIVAAQSAATDLDTVVERVLAKATPKRAYGYQELDRAPGDQGPYLTLPIHPPEVWGFGVTYKRSAEMRDEDSRSNIYDRVYTSERPEVFFKATASRCVGPNEPIGIRSDSELTATEPELAYLLDGNRQIVGYTLCNDVSAWDIERANPLYLPQSKIFYGCCALGPVIVTPRELADPYQVEITCTIVRNGRTIYQGQANTGQLNRRLEELTEYLCRDNPVPAGTVVSTGTGIMVPNELALQPGDLVCIHADAIGTLANPAQRL